MNWTNSVLNPLIHETECILITSSLCAVDFVQDTNSFQKSRFFPCFSYKWKLQPKCAWKCYETLVFRSHSNAPCHHSSRGVVYFLARMDAALGCLSTRLKIQIPQTAIKIAPNSPPPRPLHFTAQTRSHTTTVAWYQKPPRREKCIHSARARPRPCVPWANCQGHWVPAPINTSWRARKHLVHSRAQICARRDWSRRWESDLK